MKWNPNLSVFLDRFLCSTDRQSHNGGFVILLGRQTRKLMLSYHAALCYLLQNLFLEFSMCHLQQHL